MLCTTTSFQFTWSLRTDKYLWVGINTIDKPVITQPCTFQEAKPHLRVTPCLMQLHGCLANLNIGVQNPLQKERKSISCRACHLFPLVMLMAWSALNYPKISMCYYTETWTEWNLHLFLLKECICQHLKQCLHSSSNRTCRYWKPPGNQKALLGNIPFCFFPHPHGFFPWEFHEATSATTRTTQITQSHLLLRFLLWQDMQSNPPFPDVLTNALLEQKLLQDALILQVS